jgi:arginyl-tRNA synthetase
VLHRAEHGKNKGCWVMTRPGPLDRPIKVNVQRMMRRGALATEEDSLAEPYNYEDDPSVDEAVEGPDDDAKVIVRSNGTVTYVGKDIAYHLWKFGLLGRDFGYNPFFTYPDHECWISTEKGQTNHPHFGGAQAIYNVIDSRQNDPQANVIQALRGMGHTAEADHFTHFSYEMVALTPRCAIDLGYDVPEEDRGRAYIEVSGRKGFGVKADDLIDKLIDATRAEVDARQTAREETERQRIAEQIAIGALRYFMLKYTRNSVIAFDFKDALSFEGETGPYIQYAVVRARNIFRKGETTPSDVLAEFAKLSESQISDLLADEAAEDIWALWLRAGRRTAVLEQSIATSEPAYIAKHAFQLAQEFNNFYHKHHILTEENSARKAFLLATAAVALRELVTVLGWLGIESPEAM